jgi:hypothetical protein
MISYETNNKGLKPMKAATPKPLVRHYRQAVQQLSMELGFDPDMTKSGAISSYGQGCVMGYIQGMMATQIPYLCDKLNPENQLMLLIEFADIPVSAQMIGLAYRFREDCANEKIGRYDEATIHQLRCINLDLLTSSTIPGSDSSPVVADIAVDADMLTVDDGNPVDADVPLDAEATVDDQPVDSPVAVDVEVVDEAEKQEVNEHRPYFTPDPQAVLDIRRFLDRHYEMEENGIEVEVDRMTEENISFFRSCIDHLFTLDIDDVLGVILSDMALSYGNLGRLSLSKIEELIPPYLHIIPTLEMIDFTSLAEENGWVEYGSTGEVIAINCPVTRYLDWQYFTYALTNLVSFFHPGIMDISREGDI